MHKYVKRAITPSNSVTATILTTFIFAIPNFSTHNQNQLASVYLVYLKHAKEMLQTPIQGTYM